jgi:hypothetical protein
VLQVLGWYTLSLLHTTRVHASISSGRSSIPDHLFASAIPYIDLFTNTLASSNKKRTSEGHAAFRRGLITRVPPAEEEQQLAILIPRTHYTTYPPNGFAQHVLWRGEH